MPSNVAVPPSDVPAEGFPFAEAATVLAMEKPVQWMTLQELRDLQTHAEITMLARRLPKGGRAVTQPVPPGRASASIRARGLAPQWLAWPAGPIGPRIPPKPPRAPLPGRGQRCADLTAHPGLSASPDGRSMWQRRRDLGAPRMPWAAAGPEEAGRTRTTHGESSRIATPCYSRARMLCCSSLTPSSPGSPPWADPAALSPLPECPFAQRRLE